MPAEGENEGDNQSQGADVAPLGGPMDRDHMGPELEASEEESRPQPGIPRPDTPSQAEVDRHRIDLIPYRAWCPECVEGFGRERQHSSGRSEERSIPMLACGYMYVTGKGVSSKEEIAEGYKTNVLCVMVQMQSNPMPVCARGSEERGRR